MKKETKKKVFNLSLATLIVASIVTPLAIVLGKESNLLFRKNTRETTNNQQFVGSSYIDGSDYTLDLSSALSTNRTIRIANPNIAKAIPGGYVVVSGDNSNKNQQIVCLDANDPTKQKWVINLSSSSNTNDINVYGIEYSPHSNGTLVVLYSEDTNDQQYESDRINNQIRSKIFKNINNTNSTTLNHSSDLFFTYSNNSSNNDQKYIGGRLDTWTISPIFNFSGEVTKFIIYCKERNYSIITPNNDNASNFLLIDISKDSDNFLNAFKINWDGENENNTQQRKGILSTAAFEKEDTLYIAPLIINFESKKFKLDVYKSLISNTNKRFSLHSKKELSWNVAEHEISDSNNTQIAEMTKGAIGSFSFKKKNDGLSISFAINSRPNGNNIGKHRRSGIVILDLNNDFTIKNTITKDLFEQNSFNDSNIKNELWTGYFANEVIAKEGIDATLNKDLTPFIALGWSEVNKFSTNNDQAWFISLIKNPFDSSKNFYELSSNTNSNDYRVYRINHNNFYKNWGDKVNGGPFGFEQLISGVPILEYNDNANDESFSRNIFLTKNWTSKAIVINQEGRGSKTDDPASYLYQTRFLKTELSYSDLSLNKNMDSVTEQQITSLQKENIVSKFEGKNIISDSTFSISNVAFNFISGTITFDLGISKYFDDKGIFKNESKIFSLTIKDFDKKTQTTIQNSINLNNNLHNSNVYSYHLIPSVNVSYGTSHNNKSNLRFIILNTLKTNPTTFGSTFRNVSNLNIDESTFNDVFKTFKFKENESSDNKNGTIKVEIAINKKYVYSDNKDLEQTITFSGLRKIGETELISNESTNPISITSFSNKNIPYNGNKLEYYDYMVQGTNQISEEQLKEQLISEVFNKDYEKANKDNGFDTGEGTSNLTKHLPYAQTYNNQDAKDPSSKKITKDNIVLENYEFFAGKGILKVDVKLNVWNGSDNQLKHTIQLDSEQSNSQLTSAPKATWYISGFKNDNVETKFKKDNDNVWKLSGIETITIDEFKMPEYKETIEKSLLKCLIENKDLIDFPYWVNKEEILKNIQIEFDASDDIKIDEINPKQAILKVRLKDNMWESDELGKVEDKKTNAKYQEIIISGFLNPTPIKLKSENLKNIKILGNTKNIEISSEEESLKEVDEDSKRFLEIQYSVEGLNQWFNKEDFKNKLISLNGSLNDENWIIRREDIQARYALKKEYENGKIFIDVDGTNVNNNESQNQKYQLVNETDNTEFKGYININKIIDKFKVDNFEVRGTDKSPKLIIKNYVELNQLFSRYSSNNIFEILYSDKKNPDNFDSNNAIWNKNITQLTESIDLKGNFKNQFSLSFKGVDKYEVYKDNIKQDKGYILQTPEIKMVISIEINNPLNQKQIEFNFKDEQNKPIFYQNKGGFSVKIDNSNFESFISSLQLEQEQKNSLELAYYVSEYKMQEQELKQIHAEENLYNDENNDLNQKYGFWQTLDTNQPLKDLGLLVNDYVVVTIRVKKDKLTTEDKSGYAINYDQDYIPFQQRVYGYKIKTSEININTSSIQLENVGQAESASYALDGYARLKHLSLEEDEDKNYLGALVKINYFNDFYKDDKDQILVSGSGQVLVKREDGSSIKEYKDQEGKPIKDKDQKQIFLNLKSNGTPTNPTKENSSKNSINLQEYSKNSFRFDDIDSKELKYNFFQNQEIEFEISNKKGEATGEEYDYYLDDSSSSKKIEYTFTNIKFPINNDSNISYEFNSQEFIEKISNPNNVKNVYQNSLDSNKEPINGQSKLVEMFNVTRKENKQQEQKLTTLSEINNKIQQDFNGQVKLVVTYTSVDGQISQIEGGDISKIETLKNGDRFKIEIVSSSSDLIFAQQPNPLIFTVQGLYEQPIDQGLLKYLRVKQSGIIDGQGSFNILVDDPNQSNSNSDIKTLLSGYKFLVRVWDENKEIKHDWNENFISINNLKNGDKVEWKLVSPNGSPLVDSYYNTVANVDKHNVNENKYSFIQINQEGFAGKNVSEPKEGIGQNPEQSNIYPEDSGLVISGLQSEDDSSYTTITFEEFTRVMNLMNFGYSGINGSGNMISSIRALDVKLDVVGRNSETFTLDYLLKNNYISFYYNNDSSSQLNSFNWDQVKDENGNWLTSPGTLSNGDSVRIVYKDPTMSNSYEYYAPIVSGLQNKSDNMSMFSWIGIGLASFVTLGIFAFIYLYVRNRKLK